MKVLLDTNVALDGTIRQGRFTIAAEALFDQIVEEEIEGYLTSNCIADIFYIVNRLEGVRRARETLSFLFSIISILPVSDTDCYLAFGSELQDFEDALLLTCAERTGIDVIVTGDLELLRQSSPVTLLSPEQFLTRHNGA